MALKGVKVLELAGLAPVPYAGLILADFGAEVTRVDRLGGGALRDPLSRGKRSVAINLKTAEGRATLLRLVRGADVLLEPFRPGVMERFGLGPDVLLAANPRLVFARLTGWGQEGPYKDMAGHDINYIAVSGALGMVQREGRRPHPPVNLLGDFAGGGMLCAMGVLLALLERARSGKGQVVDAAMVDGSAHLASFLWGFRDMGMWGEAGTNMLDGGAPFYDCYRCKGDSGFVAVGAIEPQFFALLVEGLGLADDEDVAQAQMDRDGWPAMRAKFRAAFESRERGEWQRRFDGTDACVTPVLEMHEVATHPHNAARAAMAPLLSTSAPGALYPAPAPRLSRTPGAAEPRPEPEVGQHTEEVLAAAGFSGAEIEELREKNAIAITRPPRHSKL